MHLRLHLSGMKAQPKPKHFPWYVDALGWGKDPGNTPNVRKVTVRQEDKDA